MQTPRARLRLPRHCKVVRLGDRHVCRITNLGEEKPPMDDKLNFGTRFFRDGRPLQEQVSEDMFDAARDDAINLADMDYWFRDQPGDIQEPRSMEFMEIIPNVDFNVKNEDWSAVPLGSLSEGQVVEAEVIAMHLLHGAVIDLGCEYHGLVPINEVQWESLVDKINVEDKLTATVHKIRDPRFFRFPIQLDPHDPAIAEHMTPPDEWDCPIMSMHGMHPEALMEAANREYYPATFQDDPLMGAEGMQEIAFESDYGPTAPRPEPDYVAPGGEAVLEYDNWRAADAVRDLD